MANFLTAAAVSAKKTLSEQNIEVKHSVLLEILAGLLGYNSYRTLHSEEHDAALDSHLADAQFVILNQNFGEERAKAVCDHPGQTTKTCVEALLRCAAIPVYLSAESFYDSQGFQAVARTLDNNDVLIQRFGAPDKTTVKFAVADTVSYSEPVWKARTTWSLVSNIIASAEGEASNTEFDIKVVYRKAGRAGLIFDTSEIIASLLPRYRKRIGLGTCLNYGILDLECAISGDPKRVLIAFLAEIKSGMVLSFSLAEPGKHLHALVDTVAKGYETINSAVQESAMKADYYIESVVMDCSRESVRASKEVMKIDPRTNIFHVPPKRGHAELFLHYLQRNLQGSSQRELLGSLQESVTLSKCWCDRDVETIPTFDCPSFISYMTKRYNNTRTLSANATPHELWICYFSS